MGTNVPRPIPIFVDNMTVIQVANTIGFNVKTRHANLQIGRVRDLIKQKDIILVHVESQMNLADHITKH